MEGVENKRFVVTGGGGFVGKALCRALRKNGCSVSSISRKRYPELEALGVESISLDLGSDVDRLAEAFRGADGVFHTAAHVKMWGQGDEFFRSNVIGTRNVIAACRKANVRRLVFTSSPSVVACGKDLDGVDESFPYPDHFDSLYAMTKAQAEVEVLKNSDESLRTVSLRPHLIFGPGDTGLSTLVVQRARQGRLFIVGEGHNVVDFTYIDDCASAHLLAMEALSNNKQVAGRAFFISQGDPYPFWGWVNRVLEIHGLPPVKRRVPRSLAMAAAGILETISKFTGDFFEPTITRFVVSELATNHYFDISAAKREIGYTPSVTVEEGLARYARGMIVA